MSEKLKVVRVNWIIRGDVECPHCGGLHDFTDVDEYYMYSNFGENKDKFYEPLDMICRYCEMEFLVNGSDY